MTTPTWTPTGASFLRRGAGVAGAAGAAGAAAGALLAAFLDVLLPEQCAACGVAPDAAVWAPTSRRAHGLRAVDRPHLCAACAASLFAQPVAARLDGHGREPDLEVWAAAATSAALVQVVGAWKYHGVRGLGWPLGGAVAAAAREAPSVRDGAVVLVPVPLHRARRRQRGFNQALMLAELAGAELALPVAAGALRRARATAQQARLAAGRAREANLAGAFAAVAPAGFPGAPSALLVDDLVTAGATARAAAAALRAAGWEVAGVLALGLARARNDDADDPADDIDTPDGDS
jgi:predicted amidophosphoribosyltransferase